MVSRIEAACTILILVGGGISGWVNVKEDIAALKQSDQHHQQNNVIFTDAVKSLDSTLIDLSINMGKMSVSLVGVEREMTYLRADVIDLKKEVAGGD